MRELYIYYRVPVRLAAALLEQVTRMQDDLGSHHPGLKSRLLRRADALSPATSGAALAEETWMEIYMHPQGIDAALQAAIEAAAREQLTLPGARHIEVFEPYPPCA